MSKEGDKALDKMNDAFRVFMVGIVMIVFATIFVYLLTVQLLQIVGLSPKLVWIIMALWAFFVYKMRDKVKRLINKFLK